MNDILLLNLPFTVLGYKKMNEFASRAFPAGLGSLSAILKERGLPFKVLDADAMNLNMDRTLSMVVQQKPFIIGISAYTSYADMTEYAVREIKKRLKDSIVVLGGHDAFAKRGELLKETLSDVIVIGEGELTFLEMCDALLNKRGLDGVKGLCFRRGDHIFYTGDREYIKDLDALPMPAYENFPMDRYQGHFYRRWISGRRKPFSNIITSRGCPFNCGFCSNVLWGKVVRFQSPERVIHEIGHLVKNYGMRQLSFFDDTFTLNMKRAERICDLIIERNYGLDIYCSTRVDFLNEGLIKKMARSGFKWVGIGIESGNERILKKISKSQSLKNCSEVLRMLAANRIAIYGNIILGYPGEDKGTLKDSLRFILNNPVHLPQFNIFVPYPGTPVYNELAAKGVNIPTNMNPLNKILSYNKDITANYLEFFQWYSYLRSFFRIRYVRLIKKTFKMRIVFSDMVNLVWAMLSLGRKKNKFLFR